jgi:ribose/xylose/arabinose/galactoside ABC-type transport system permease subunit
MNTEISKHFRHNLVVNVLDAGLFGFGLGFASFVTILPLFVSTLTDSAILIGLVPAIHQVGWQLPQLFIARRVARLTRYKPMVIRMTLHERLPFLGLAAVAWFLRTRSKAGRPSGAASAPSCGAMQISAGSWEYGCSHN